MDSEAQARPLEGRTRHPQRREKARALPLRLIVECVGEVATRIPPGTAPHDDLGVDVGDVGDIGRGLLHCS